GLGFLFSLAFPALKRAVGKLMFTCDVYPLGLLGCLNHVRSIRRFKKDAASGRLPAVSIVDPDFMETSEENPHDIQEGERFSASVINAVMEGPAWEKTLLVWVYDEHGGYYEQVAPPPTSSPDGVGGHSFRLEPAPLSVVREQLGLRKK